MKNLIRFLTVGAGLFLYAFAFAGPRVSEVADGKVYVFDGKSLKGWESMKGKQSPERINGWIIEEGCIFREKKGGDLYLQGTYGDFEMSFEWKVAKASNSGVKYRVKSYDGKTLGLEFQVLDDEDPKWSDDDPFLKAGAIYYMKSPNTKKSLKPVGEFNSSKIVVRQGKIEHWLNGELILQDDTTSEDWKRRVKKSKYKKYPEFGANTLGRIFLQDHQDPIWYRAIVVKPL